MTENNFFQQQTYDWWKREKKTKVLTFSCVSGFYRHRIQISQFLSVRPGSYCCAVDEIFHSFLVDSIHSPLSLSSRASLYVCANANYIYVSREKEARKKNDKWFAFIFPSVGWKMRSQNEARRQERLRRKCQRKIEVEAIKKALCWSLVRVSWQ